MPITIQEIIASDTISQLVDKTNFNFDQLLLNGGGPAGPPGIQGPIGPVGGRGPKGTTWFEDTSTVAPGVTPTAVPPTATPLPGDYYLQFNGDVWEFVSTVWLQTTINLIGPQGPAGPPGGFGLAFGYGAINNENTLYNGQIGTTATGVSSVNEGVPSILVGGISSIYDPTTSPQPTVPLTAAYLLPLAIETQLQSSEASLIIHQKNSTGRSIIFHGGNAVGNTDNYEQSTIQRLSNITLGVNDRLQLNIPKTAVGALAIMDDLVGFEVNSSKRSHSHNAGQRILFKTGLDPATYGVTGENSNFDIEVGPGNGSDNKFAVSTLSSGAETDMQMGGSITLSAGQITNPGVLQFLNGVTRFDVTATGSGTGAFKVNAQGSISLNTNVANSVASPPINLTAGGSGGITLNTQTGNINIDGAGNIRIAQTSPTVTATENILISNSSTNDIGTGGNITVEGNCAIILKNEVNNVFDAPSIAINMDGGGVPPPTPPNAAHTAFIGGQTWAGVPLGGFTTPLANTLQFNNLDSVLLNGDETFRQTGSDSLTALGSNVFFEKWLAGTQSATSAKAGLLGIVLGSESGASSNFMYDKSLGFGVRNVAGTEDYFNASSNKISFATPMVLKRSKLLNSLQNSSPTSVNFSHTSAGAGGKLTTEFGWNTAANASPSPSTGMPTTADLNVPLITLSYGGGQSIYGFSSTELNNTGYDLSFEFPEGAYPGQRLTLKIYNQAKRYVYSTGSSSKIFESYGLIRILIPVYRIKMPQNAANYSSWYRPAGTNGGQTYNAGFATLFVSTSATDMNRGTGRIQTVELLWDGLEIGQYGINTGAVGPYDRETTSMQFGWTVVSSLQTTVSIGGPLT